jgi:DNA polymerase-3 subunit delta'
MRFSNINGLASTKQHLISSARRNHVAHAQLFAGVEGSAVLPMALAFATYLNCENPGDEDACGECPSCVKSLKYIHPDMHFVFPVSFTDKITGKDVVSKSFLPAWREFLLGNPYGSSVDWAHAFGGENKQLNISKQESREIIEALSLKAFEGKYKIMILWMPELMHPSAANGILKVLEEPADKTVFLLVSASKDRLLPTILSRTQLVRIPGFSDDELINILSTEHGIEVEKATQLAHLADGSLRTALQINAEADINIHSMFTEWMRYCFQNNFPEITALSEKFASLSKSAQKSLLLYSLEILRDSLVFTQGEDQLQRMSGEALSFVQNFSKTVNLLVIDQLSRQISDAHYHLERNVNAKITFMNLSIVFSNSFNR